MKVVLDTNVLVAGLLNPFGACGEIVRMVSGGELVLCHDARILDEYREVLLRAKFRFRGRDVEALLDFIARHGETVPSSPLPQPLPDPWDEPFLEVAISGGAEVLVTGNLRHFPKSARGGMRVLSPDEFLSRYRARQEE